MGLDLGQSQLGDVLGEFFQALVFGNPRLDLLEQILGHVNGAGFALLFAGQVVSGMAWSLLAMTAGAAATPVNQDQTGGKDGRFRLKVFEPGQEMAADEGGVLGDVDSGAGAGSGRFHIGYVILLIR